MFRAIRRVFGVFTVFVMILGAIKSVFTWLANGENDNHEVFIDEDESEILF